MICTALLLALLSVGPGKTYAKPSQAAAAAKDGDTVEIAAGAYPGDVAVWRASRLTLRGKGGRVVLNAQGQSAERKAIWVIQGDDTWVENIEFVGASVPDRNGAGIRQEGQGMIVSNCFFYDNENGILWGMTLNPGRMSIASSPIGSMMMQAQIPRTCWISPTGASAGS